MATVTKNEYTGDGVTTIFSITFPYIEFSDVKVYVDGALKTQDSDYIFATATSISLVTAPAVDAPVVLQRVTSSEDLKFTFFPGSAIRARDLNDNFTQSLYVIQEADIEADSATDAAEEAVKAAKEAKEVADLAKDTADDALEGVETAEAAAVSAQTSATAAQTSADNAEASAQQAQTDANQALTTANEANAKADEALDAVSAGPVQSVNGKTGVVSLTTSDLTNDSGYITSADAPINNIDLTLLSTLPWGLHEYK